LDNFHGRDCAVDGCRGGGFWARRGASSACPGRHFGRDEFCLPPQIVELTIAELKIVELRIDELIEAVAFTEKARVHDAKLQMTAFAPECMKNFPRAVNTLLGSHNTQ